MGPKNGVKALYSLVGVCCFITLLVTVYFFRAHLHTFKSAHLMCWRNGAGFGVRVKVIKSCLFLTIGMISIVSEALTCKDYINGKSVYFRPVPAVKAVFGILVLLNIATFCFKWYFLVRLWERHVQFFEEHAFLYTEEPNIIYQVKLILVIILHDLVHKLLTYFYFARYKPLNMDLTFWTIADLIQDNVENNVTY